MSDEIKVEEWAKMLVGDLLDDINGFDLSYDELALAYIIQQAVEPHIKHAHAAGAAAEQARITGLLAAEIDKTRERCRKLSETDEYLSVLGELDGLRRFSGKVAP